MTLAQADAGSNDDAGGTLSCCRDGDLLWSSALTSRALLLAGNAGWSAAACEDGSLVLFTAAGRRAAPTIHAVGGAAALHADDTDGLLLVGNEQALVSLNLKKPIDAEVC